MPAPPSSDALGRPLLAEGMKRQLADALRALPPDATAALLVIGDTETARLHVVANLPGEGWKVAAGGGWAWGGTKPQGWFAIEKVWGGQSQRRP